MPSIFLSHNSKDKPFARKLADSLASKGIYVWIDEANLKIGDSLVPSISRAIKEIDYIGAIISPNSINSEWVKKELSWAMSKEIKNKSISILPILIESCELPDYLMDKLYADFRNSEMYDDELKKLLRAMGIDSGTKNGIYKHGIAIEWPGEGPRISGNNVVLSVSESNALYSRYLDYYDKFVAKAKKNDGKDFELGAANVRAVLKACEVTYNNKISEEELKTFKTELAKKFDLFYKFVMVMWETVDTQK